MVRHPVQDKYQDREADRAEQELEEHFGVHLICCVSGRLEKPSRCHAKAKHQRCRYQGVSDRHGVAPQIAADERGNSILCGLGTCGAFVLLPLGSMQAHVIVSSESSLPLPKSDRAGTARRLDGKS